MPLIRYKCSNKECDFSFSVFVKKAEDVKDTVECKKCKNNSKRLLSAPNSSSTITIDNGLQAKAVEVNPNIMELRENWTKAPDRGD